MSNFASLKQILRVSHPCTTLRLQLFTITTSVCLLHSCCKIFTCMCTGAVGEESCWVSRSAEQQDRSAIATALQPDAASERTDSALSWDPEKTAEWKDRNETEAKRKVELTHVTLQLTSRNKQQYMSSDNVLKEWMQQSEMTSFLVFT